MRYNINFDKTINQLVPHFLGGRKLILFLQGLIKPLQDLNNEFVKYAKRTRIEASMTSQIFKFEWYLNSLFEKYFLNGGQITIQNGYTEGVSIYHENTDIDLKENLLLYKKDEGKDNVSLHYENENLDSTHYSFIVTSPEIDKRIMSNEKYLAMLRYHIDKYRLAGKTYTIKFTN